MSSTKGHTRHTILWWEPPKDSLPIQFCESTSLHGLRYIGQSKRNMVERVFWLIAFLIGIIVACVLINDIWFKYKTNPIITTFEGTPSDVHQVPFPAITICNVNSIEKDKAMKIIQEGYSGKLAALARVSLLDHICSAMEVSFSQKFGFHSNGSQVPDDLLAKLKDDTIGVLDGEDALNMTIQEFLHKNSQSCEDMLLLCSWQDNIYNCSDLFQPTESEFGKCCTFNMIPRSLLYTFTNYRTDSKDAIDEWNASKISNDLQWLSKDEIATDDVERLLTRKFPRRASNAGLSRGLSVLLNPGLDQYFCSTADFDGMKFSAHQPLSTPEVGELGGSIAPNTEAFVSIRPEIVKAEPSLRGIDLKARNCYFDGEFRLGYFKYYTELNCLEECRSNFTYRNCRCVHYYMPRDPIVHDICGPASFKCAEQVLNILAMNSHEWKENCGFCLPTCNDIRYETELYDAQLRDLNIWLKKANTSGSGSHDTTKWSNMKVSIAHFYFGEEGSYPKLRKELFGFTELLASTGGILGLCLGFSALSLLEIIYFASIRLVCKVLRKKRFADVESNELAIGNTAKFGDKKMSVLYPNFLMRELIPAHLRRELPWSTVYHEN